MIATIVPPPVTLPTHGWFLTPTIVDAPAKCIDGYLDLMNKESGHLDATLRTLIFLTRVGPQDRSRTWNVSNGSTVR
tara:strand:+ start:1056 stop:1286 length:231 start_codon:yes stop_codon:yes gene_type:complete